MTSSEYNNLRYRNDNAKQRMAPNRIGTIVQLPTIVATLFSFSAHAQVPYGADSVAKGKALFLANCTACHGSDGRSRVDVISDATDLTEPELYRNGKTDAEIERSIREGVGVMPAWGPIFNSNESIGHLRNFIKNLWPANQRPE